jgi:DnaJ-domain-containing protein 1
VELIISALCNDLLGTYQAARSATVAPSAAFSRSLKLRMTYGEVLVVEKFLQGKGSFDARRHGRNLKLRLIDALESSRLSDLVFAVGPWEMSAVQLRRVAATTSRAQRAGTARREVMALFTAVENGLVRTYKAARVRIPDVDEALITSLRVHISDDQWWLVRQFLRSDAGKDVLLHLRAALESDHPAHLRALFAPWSLSPAGPDSSADPPPCRPRRAQPDLYAVLGVGREATGEAIRTAYKTLCQIYHPDRYQSASTAVVQEAEARMVALNHAYQCLSDEGSRAQYDASVRQY